MNYSHVRSFFDYNETTAHQYVIKEIQHGSI